MARKKSRKEDLTRRDFLYLGGGAAGTIVASNREGAASRTQPTGTSPNVLVIYSDEHRFDCIGAAGNPDLRTPHLDGLAGDGVLFRNAFCTYPVCTASRYSLLTGLYTHQHRGMSNRSAIEPGIPTFPQVLREQGYQTAAVGKMHFEPIYADVGFERMKLAEQNGRGRLVDDYHRFLKENDRLDVLDLLDQKQDFRSQAPEEYWKTFGAGPSNLPEEFHSTTWIGNRAVEELSAWTASRPGLLMASFIKPHHPFDPPVGWAEMYDPEKLEPLSGWLDKPLESDIAYNTGYFEHNTLSEPSLRRIMAQYYATISQIDAQVGRMIEALKRNGLYDNTLIIYSSDHGEYMGFHHLLLKGNYMYDPVVKIPLIVKFPGQTLAGTRSDSLVSTLDAVATILRLAGGEPLKDMRGSPLEDICCGRTPERTSITCEFTQRDYVMVRTREAKLLYSSQPHLEPLFFDLRRDPLELKNRFHAKRYRSRVADLKDRLLAWYQQETHTEAYTGGPRAEVGGASQQESAEMERYIQEKMGEFLSSVSSGTRTSIYGPFH